MCQYGWIDKVQKDILWSGLERRGVHIRCSTKMWPETRNSKHLNRRALFKDTHATRVFHSTLGLKIQVDYTFIAWRARIPCASAEQITNIQPSERHGERFLARGCCRQSLFLANCVFFFFPGKYHLIIVFGLRQQLSNTTSTTTTSTSSDRTCISLRQKGGLMELAAS